MAKFKPTIIIDSREQTPWTFSDAVFTEVAGLKQGDYSVKGLEHRIAIERKNLSDLTRSITKGREKLIDEMRRLSKYDIAMIVVEADYWQIKAEQYVSTVSAKSILGTLNSFFIKYGIPYFLWGNATDCAERVEHLLINFAGTIDKDHKALHADEVARKKLEGKR